MIDTTKSNVPDGFILLQTQNGTPKYAACMTGRLAGWLMKKYPDGNWVSERKLTNLELMQAEDQRDDGIVHDIQEPVMVAEPVGYAGEMLAMLRRIHAVDKNAGYQTDLTDSTEELLARIDAAPMVADPAGVARYFVLEEVACSFNPESEYPITESMAQKRVLAMRDKSALAATVKAVPSEALDAVEGDVLPPIGSKVFIHLARQDEWVEHTVTGYYAWGDLGKNPALHRVFVRVKDAQGYDNARLLMDVRFAAPLADKTGGGE